jgi:hypothetical protein
MACRPRGGLPQKQGNGPCGEPAKFSLVKAVTIHRPRVVEMIIIDLLRLFIFCWTDVGSNPDRSQIFSLKSFAVAWTWSDASSASRQGSAQPSTPATSSTERILMQRVFPDRALLALNF